VEAVLAGEADPAEAGLAEVVPAGPGEVADEVRVASAQSPQRIDAGGTGFGADDDPVGKQSPVRLAPGFEVVEAGGLPGLRSSSFRTGRFGANLGQESR
jgi:hypothetical protein